ncbi:hypothetical protein AB0B45_39425 [Nonomuraea sp. NPDC049152]|uniref:hypothetical protein n=1 Tax=Nonomuraea sp. NPDC049152 TaxID=3154350 RepID=UPI0033F24B06
MRLIRGMVAGMAVGCALTTAGCTVALPFADPHRAHRPTPTTTPTTKPSAKPSAPTREDFAGVLADYVERNNTANAKQDVKLLEAYEGGSSLAIDKASYASSTPGGGPHPAEEGRPRTVQGSRQLLRHHRRERPMTPR